MIIVDKLVNMAEDTFFSSDTYTVPELLINVINRG